MNIAFTACFLAFIQLIATGQSIQAAQLSKFDRQRYLAESDFSVESACGQDSRNRTSAHQKDKDVRNAYCLQLTHMKKTSLIGRVPMMITPGFFQNTFILDLVPKEGISWIRHVEAKFPVKVYVLNPRGTLGSDYPSNSNLDDIAIDDFTTAVSYLVKLTGGPIIVTGHSQGAIMTQAYLSGLTRCYVSRSSKKNVNCFNEKVAKDRQKSVLAAGLIAGSVTMSTDDKGLLGIARAGVVMTGFLKVVDRIAAGTLTDFLAPNVGMKPFALHNFWSFLYNPENVGRSARLRLYSHTLDHSSGDVILQFAKGVSQQNIRSSSGEYYSDALKNIHVPVYQMTMSLDGMAPPTETFETSFLRIGSEKKQFIGIQNRGHEDLFMNSELHSDSDPMLTFLLDSTKIYDDQK